MINQSMRNKIAKREKIIKVKKCVDLEEMIAFIEKNVKPRPNLDVVKWMAKNGR